VGDEMAPALRAVQWAVAWSGWRGRVVGAVAAGARVAARSAGAISTAGPWRTHTYGRPVSGCRDGGRLTRDMLWTRQALAALLQA